MEYLSFDKESLVNLEYSLHREILDDAAFRAGKHDIHYLATIIERWAV